MKLLMIQLSHHKQQDNNVKRTKNKEICDEIAHDTTIPP